MSEVWFYGLSGPLPASGVSPADDERRFYGRDHPVPFMRIKHSDAMSSFDAYFRKIRHIVVFFDHTHLRILDHLVRDRLENDSASSGRIVGFPDHVFPFDVILFAPVNDILKRELGYFLVFIERILGYPVGGGGGFGGEHACHTAYDSDDSAYESYPIHDLSHTHQSISTWKVK